MRNKKWMSMLAMLMSVTMLLPACGVKEEEKNDVVSEQKSSEEVKEEVSSSEEASEESQEVEEEDPLKVTFPLEETVTFTILTAAGNASKLPAEEKEGVKRLEELTNVHIEWLEVPQSGVSEKVNLMMNTGDLPDAIITYADANAHAEMLVTFEDEMLQKYAPTTWELFERRPDLLENSKNAYGDLKKLPGSTENRDNMVESVFWINQKWLDTLGLEMPKTTEDLKEVLIAFRDQDPNGNGKQDEIPMTFLGFTEYATNVGNLFGYFGSLETGGHYYMKDGVVEFTPDDDGYYEALKYLNELYNEGLLDPDILALSTEQYAVRGQLGGDVDVLGIASCYNQAGAGLLNADDYVMMPVLTDGKSEPLRELRHVTIQQRLAITTACEQPELLMQWYDYLNSSLEMKLLWGYGVEDHLVSLEEIDGETYIVEKTGPLLKEVLAETGYASKAELRQSESFGGQTIAWFDQSYNDHYLLYNGTEYSPMEERYNLLKDDIEAYGVYQMPRVERTDEEMELLNLIAVDIDSYITKFNTDAILNGIDDAKWEAHLEALKELRADEYVKLQQAAYDRTYK